MTWYCSGPRLALNQARALQLGLVSRLSRFCAAKGFFRVAAFGLRLHYGFVQELAIGTLLGHYKVVRRIGEGGMGVVYEAEDQRLGRPVALKVLPEKNDGDQIALERFWREARVAASLNHPGICVIYELNESGIQPFIVMELLEGESLDKLSYQRPLPVARLLDFGIQIADALDAAHRKGVLHRDIKPGNLFLSPSGKVKILDFGLAKLDESNARDANPFSTRADGITSPGSAVGTIAYMSPEQARGETLDARSDLFSLGVVLYELATARHPFSGATSAVTFDRILNVEPTAPLSINPELPPELAATLSKTLEKDRDLRCQSAAELRSDLKRLSRKSGGSSRTPPSDPESSPADFRNGKLPSEGVSLKTSAFRSVPPAEVHAAINKASSRRKVSHGIAVVLGAAVLLAVAGFGAWRLWPRAVPFASISLSQITNTGNLENVALSADGKFLAEVKNDGGRRTIWIRNIATNTDTQILPAFQGEYVGLTFSPDANYLYFTRSTVEKEIRQRSLFSMPVFGGIPRPLIRNIDSAASLSPDGSRFSYLRYMPASSGHYAEIRIADKDGSNDQAVYSSPIPTDAPAWSPQSDQLAWVESPGPLVTHIAVFDLATKARSTVAAPQDILFAIYNTATDLTWLPDGKHLLVLYLRNRTPYIQVGMVALPRGDFHSVSNDLNAYSQLALSHDGKTLATVMTNVDSRIAYYKGDGGAMVSSLALRITPSALAWQDDDHLWMITIRAGINKMQRSAETLLPVDIGEIDAGTSIASCPDGIVLFNGRPKSGRETRLFRMNGDGSDIVQLTHKGIAGRPVCGSDSHRVYFTTRDGASTYSFWSMPVAGGEPRQELSGAAQDGPIYVSTKAKLAAVDSRDPSGQYLATIFDTETGQVVRRLPINKSAVGSGAFSPDGKGIVREIVTGDGHALEYQPIDGTTPHLLTAPGPEALAAFAWSPSGAWLGVLQSHSSSDVVLITDLTGKRDH